MDPERLLRRLVAPGVHLGTPDQDQAVRRASQGYGGLCLFGGDVESVRSLTSALRSVSREPLAIMADYEDGAGAWVHGATEFPTNMAIGATGSEEHARRKGIATAREMRWLGVDLTLAPVADVQRRPENPIVNVRSFGGDPNLVLRMARAFVVGVREGGGRSCAKHFPGHGDAAEDSHIALPVVHRVDVEPFRCGADSVMVGHLRAVDLDARRPATVSPVIVSALLRHDLEFRGPVLSDALIMKAVAAMGAEEDVAVRAIEAGIDLVLVPTDPDQVVARLVRAYRGGRLGPHRVAEAIGRIAAALEGMAGAEAGTPPQSWNEHVLWAEEAARAAIHVRGSLAPGRPRRIVTVRDDTARHDDQPFRQAAGQSATGPTVVAIFSGVRSFRGTLGLPAELLEQAREARPDVVVVFGNPYTEREFPGLPIIHAWGDAPALQRAAADVLTGILPAQGIDPR